MKKILIFLGVVAMVGCKKFLNVNDSPNTPTVTRSDYVFSNAINRTAARMVDHSGMAGSWVGYTAHSTSFTGGGQEKTYQYTNNDFLFFDAMYDNLADYQHVITNGDADGFGHLVGPAKIMQAFLFQKLVDMYGDVPYSQSLQGTAFISPQYDDDQAIYEDLILKLDEAISDLKAATSPSAEPADIVFGGNLTNWIRFANSLKMRILMRQSFMPGRDGYITTEINKIVAEGTGFITDNVLAQPGYSKAVNKLNLFYGVYGYNENDVESGTYRFRKANRVIVDWLKNTADQFRLQRLVSPKVGGNPAAPADYIGVPLGGDGSTYLETLVSSIGSVQIVKGAATRPMILMALAEVYLLRAEAAQRYGIAALGTALTNYENGVRSAFRLAAATHTSTASATNAQADAAADAYMLGGGNNVNFAASTDKVRAILIQKWVALAYVDALESWSEYRKSNGSAATMSTPTSPKSIVVPGSQAEPVRLFYPLREESVNGANVPQNINVFTSRIFWDVN